MRKNDAIAGSTNDIQIGLATVCAVKKGEWMLPGGIKTRDEISAIAVAINMDELLKKLKFKRG